ncbi:MAG: hypothetical protein RBG13Loki_0936 [Promethearchaeota archaeon CR_4]|nr:MAG: hypothetical protein RBG13Loki_0936 [Candidatus Lokiarchaeota archaeon CR_4]
MTIKEGEGFSTMTKKAGLSTTFEESLERIAWDAWDEAIADYYFPALAKPKLVFDSTHREGFYIDTQEWRVTLNLLEVPPFVGEKEIHDFLHSISQHEIGHYDLCPYDGLTAATLLSAAMKKVSETFAPLVVNIFADLVIDTQLWGRFRELTEWRLREEIKDIFSQEKGKKKTKFSETWKILVKAYEYLWDVDLGLNAIDFTQADAKAHRIAAIIAPKLLEKTTWESKVTKIASLLKANLNEDFTLQVGERRTRGGQVCLKGPEDYERQFGDPSEIKSREKVQGKIPTASNADAERFAKDRNFSDYGAPARAAGLIHDGSTLATWYRGRARDLISIHIYETKPGGSLPAYPENWRIGDPLEDLDLLLSAQVSPVIIPNITTRKWRHKEGPACLEEKIPPDLLIVLDSSGSMNWNPEGRSDAQRGEYDIATVAAFAAAHFAFSRGCKVAVLNFSDVAITCDWTTQYAKVEGTILQYQGGGTVVPIQSLKKLARNADRHTLILIITDFGLNNFNSTIKACLELAVEGHSITGFFIGADDQEFDRNPRFTNLHEHGIFFYPVKQVKELIGLVIEEVKRYY